MKQTSINFQNESTYQPSKDITLIVSFSGGRTSGFLTYLMLQQKSKWKNIKIVFANTGQEHEKTLEFINKCDKNLGFKTVWVEAVHHQEKGKGVTHKIVNFETASRNGEPFENAIKKFGLPFTKSPHCTRELKNYPINSYIKSLGLAKKDYKIAIGIRADESKRANITNKQNFIFPLLDENTDKQDVLDWWEDQTFDLEIPEHFGNCVWCWKKSYKKLMTVMHEEPNAFDFPERMEKLYSRNGAVSNKLQKDIKMFRGWKSTDDIKQMMHEGFEKYIDLHYLHISNGCEESCEPFLDETPIKIIEE